MNCRRILCMRLDNMGDLLMSSPAIWSLKQATGAHITLLTSFMAAPIASLIPGIDEVITMQVPWVKSDQTIDGAKACVDTVQLLKQGGFDAAVIFTVFSQNPLPAAMLAYMAGIPIRMAYCRENPYELLTHWVPDAEPYSKLVHQVQRDLDLLRHWGITPDPDDALRLSFSKEKIDEVREMLLQQGIDLEAKPWLILHPGVSEAKRCYPEPLWREVIRMIREHLDYRILIAGSSADSALASRLVAGHDLVHNLAGAFNLHQYVALVAHAPLMLCVNTAAAHIAAAVGTPEVVLYALSNPQHAPWKGRGRVLLYEVPSELQSKNEVLRFVQEHLHPKEVGMAQPDAVLSAISAALLHPEPIPAMIPLRRGAL